MIEVILFFSGVFNIFLLWYIVQLLRRFLTFQEELDDFFTQLEEYEGHVDMIHSLERFYGDETLGNLLRHSKAVVEECKRFQNVLSDNENEEETEIEKEYEDAEEEY